MIEFRVFDWVFIDFNLTTEYPANEVILKSFFNKEDFDFLRCSLSPLTFIIFIRQCFLKYLLLQVETKNHVVLFGALIAL